ncbi:MAG: DUF2975 domain-containing protein [Oscillospiraceae bacterium]
MRQKTLAKWLKWVLVGVGLCGLALCLWVLPAYGRSLAYRYPEFSYCYLPWLLFLWIAAVPCYIDLGLAWRIVRNIEADRSFSLENARLLQYIAVVAAADAAFFFIMNIIYLLLSMSHPGITLVSFVVTFIIVSVAVAAAALSHLVRKAAELQEQSDLTI